MRRADHEARVDAVNARLRGEDVSLPPGYLLPPGKTMRDVLALDNLLLAGEGWPLPIVFLDDGSVYVPGPPPPTVPGPAGPVSAVSVEVGP